MSRIDIPITLLPDLEMYGGDTEPWVFDMVHAGGRRYSMGEAMGYTCSLTITPFTYAAGLGSETYPKTLQMNGTIEAFDGEGASAVFRIASATTKNMAGKYIYQVELSAGEEKRIGQGSLFVRSNINR